MQFSMSRLSRVNCCSSCFSSCSASGSFSSASPKAGLQHGDLPLRGGKLFFEVLHFGLEGFHLFRIGAVATAAVTTAITAAVAAAVAERLFQHGDFVSRSLQLILQIFDFGFQRGVVAATGGGRRGVFSRGLHRVEGVKNQPRAFVVFPHGCEEFFDGGRGLGKLLPQLDGPLPHEGSGGHPVIVATTGIRGVGLSRGGASGLARLAT